MYRKWTQNNKLIYWLNKRAGKTYSETGKKEGINEKES